MDYKKTLLGVASLLALTAGMQDTANASVQRVDRVSQVATPGKGTVGIQSEVFLDLLARTNGSLSEDAIESAIADIFSKPAAEQIEGTPELLRGLAGLGLSTEAIHRLKEILGEVVSSAENLDDALRTSVLTRLDSEAIPFVLAQARRPACTAAQLRDPRLRAQCDPREVGQTRERGRDPNEIGQVAPGAGGGYQ